MRIAMILRPDSDRVFGGDTVVMQALAAEMCTAGAEVVVGKLPDMPPATAFDLVHVFCLTPVAHAQSIISWAQAGGIGIVHSPLYYSDFRDWFERVSESSPRWRRLVAALGKQRAWPVYRAWQTTRLPVQADWQAMRKALLAADVVATTSTWENGWLAKHFRLPARVVDRMTISPLGIDARAYGRDFSQIELAGFRARYGLPEGYVAQVSRIERKKNQLAVIEALMDDPVPLVFAGKPSPYYAPDYAERCYEAGKRRGNTYFIGWVLPEDLPRLYAAAAAHILPSWVELPGLSSLEAGAAGTRVISTCVSPLPALLGDLAWYVDPYDRISIRGAVLDALSRPVPGDLAAKLRTEYNWPAVAAANLTLYETALRARTGTQRKPRRI